MWTVTIKEWKDVWIAKIHPMYEKFLAGSSELCRSELYKSMEKDLTKIQHLKEGFSIIEPCTFTRNLYEAMNFETGEVERFNSLTEAKERCN